LARVFFSSRSRRASSTDSSSSSAFNRCCPIAASMYRGRSCAARDVCTRSATQTSSCRTSASAASRPRQFEVCPGSSVSRARR
jgi:hypothetical protein